MAKLIFDNHEEKEQFYDVVDIAVQSSLQRNVKIISDAAETGVKKALCHHEERISWIEAWLAKIRLSPNVAISLVTFLFIILLGLSAYGIIK